LSPSPAHAHMPRVRLLTLNFFLRPPGISERGSQGDWKNERLALFAATQFAQYDVIALQETFASLSGRRATLIALARQHGFAYVAEGKPHRIWALRVDAGLIVLSRFPVVARDEWTFGRGTEIGDWLAAKAVLYACIELPNNSIESTTTTTTTTTTRPRRLHLFSTHFQSTDTPRALVLRHKQYIEAKRFIDRTLGCRAQDYPCCNAGRSAHDPVLFVGDMNVDARHADDPDGVQHADEYLRMLDIYSGRANDPGAAPGEGGGDLALKWHVTDVCHERLGHHPITTSRLRLGPGQPDPDRKCIDFVLSADEAALPPIAYENVRIEKFLVQGQPFSALSDHFGVALDMVW
ncbi:Endonuclease/exonuclease/phosphatase, partial [Powellomyces hirtus]